MWLNVGLTPGSLRRSRSSGMGSSAFWVMLPLCPTGSVLGENSFYRATGVNGHIRPVSCAPSSGTQRESSSQAKFRDGTLWGL